MKKILSFMLIGLLVFSLAGCSEKIPDIAVRDIMTNIENESEIAKGLSELDFKKADLQDFEKQMIESFGIDIEDIEEGIMKFPMINLQVDSVILLKVNNEEKLPEVKASLENYVENQRKAFENYMPQNLEVINNHILKEKGKYMILIISNEAEKIDEAFEKAFSEE